MAEKAYKTMRITGAGNIVLGVVMVVTGVAAGILTIISGVCLLRNKRELTF